MKRKLFWGGIALVIVLLVAWSLQPQPEMVDTATVERGALQVTVDEEGETRVRERYEVSAPVAGRVLRIELEPGDPVAAGETVLATFQPSAPVPLDVRARAEAEARVRGAAASLGQARAERDRARAELDYAAAEVERYRQLAADEVVSRDALDNAERRHRTAREALQAAGFAVETATHELERARAMLMEGDGSVEDGASDDPIVLRSPIDGVVLSRRRESESVVPAGEPLLEVADVADLEIVSDLLSTDAVQVRRGQPVRIERWGGGDVLHGTVRRVEPSGFTKISALGVEEQRVNVVVDFTDPVRARESLGDAYRVELRIVVWEREDVLEVPTSALFRRGDDWAVFTVEGGQARERVVDVGRRNGLAAEVLSGLEAGEEVIVHPSDAITDGVSVAERST